jgi:plastocyanin
MRSTDRTLARPMPIMISLLAALVLAMAACTAESGASVESSASAEASTASAEASTEASMEESAEASEDGGDLQVDLVDFQFDPTELTVSVGDTVTFVNGDSAPHTVTEGTNGNAADDARFDEQVAAGESVEVTFDEAGDYDVTCLFHGTMNMVVHVE